MIAFLSQGSVDPGASGGALAAYVALGVSVLTPLGALINAWAQRRTRGERAGAAKKTYAEGDAIATGTPLEWRTTDHQALLDERAFSKELRDRADKAEAKVREVSDLQAETDRRCDSIEEDLRQLRLSISACPGGPACPLRPVPGPSGDGT